MNGKQAALIAIRNPKVILIAIITIVVLALLLAIVATGAGIAKSIEQAVGGTVPCSSPSDNKVIIDKFKESEGYKNLSPEQKEAQDKRLQEAQANTGAAQCGGFGYTGAVYPPAFGRITDDYGVRDGGGWWHGGIDIQYAGTSPYADVQPPPVVARDKDGKTVTIQPCDPRGCRYSQSGAVGDNTCGQPIYAMFGGEVLVGHGNDPGGEEYDNSGGYQGGGVIPLGRIVIKVKEDLYLRYFHTRSSSDVVIPGQIVDAGQVIGYSWSNGNSSACHVHVEVWGTNPEISSSNCPINPTVPANGGHGGSCSGGIVGGTYNPATILAQSGFWFGWGHIFQPVPPPEPPAPGSSETPVVERPEWARFADPNGWTGGFPTVS